MNHKEQIDNLKNNAELAWASYFKFDLIGERFKDEEEYKDKRNKPITHTDILNLTYNGYETENSTFFNTQKLNGDMSPNQAKRFFERYELLEYYPKDNSKGFHACLFQHKESKQYTIAIRGSYDARDYLEADFWNLLTKGQVPKSYYENMLDFFIECISQYPQIKAPNSLTLTGHSLGGTLAQMLALSICNDKDRKNIKALYTYNSPGARMLSPPYCTIVKIPEINILNNISYRLEAIEKQAKEILSNFMILDEGLKGLEHRAIEAIKDKLNKIFIKDNVNQYFGLNFNNLNISYYRVKPHLVVFYKTFIDNYINTIRYLRYDDYTLAIQDSIYHCETSNNEYANEWYLGSPISKLGIKLGLNKDNKDYNPATNSKYITYHKLLYTITTGQGITGSHSIIPLAQTLYFYSYLLELDSNSHKIKDKTLDECIEYCNKFINDIKIHLETFVIKTNTNNTSNFERKNGYLASFRPKPKEIDFLEIFLSRIAVIINKANKELSLQGDSFYTQSMQPTIKRDFIIDFIITLSKNKYYIKILDKEYFAKIRKECDYINNIENIGYKTCLAEYRNFIIINKDNKPLENAFNLSTIYGYHSSIYKSVNNKWCEISLGSHCKIIQGLYFNGKSKIFVLKDA